MNPYLYKQFYRNKTYLFALLFLLITGLIAIYTGKNFLDKNESIIAKSAAYQEESIRKNVELHPDNMGSLLYYIRFNYVNQTPKLAALNIGMRDLNPSIQAVTIRNLEEQKHNSDFYNPANIAAGNFDFSFVLIFLFPLVIISFCYNIISEDQEKGTWKLLSIQSNNLKKLINSKLLIRFLAISAVYILLLMIALVWIQIPIDLYFLSFGLVGWLYLIFWFMLCRWMISFQKTSAQNALLLVLIWLGINFIVPMMGNLVIENSYPLEEGLQAQIEQREGYHNRWDEAKAPTMQKFYKEYPQFSNYKVSEDVASSYTWYYAMQHMGDVASRASSQTYDEKLKQRSKAATYLGFLFPNIHTQLSQSNLAKTGMENHLNYAEALKNFHESQRLYFYPLIFSEQPAAAVNWKKQTVKTYTDTQEIEFIVLLLPYFIFIGILFGLSQNKFKKLC